MIGAIGFLWIDYLLSGITGVTMTPLNIIKDNLGDVPELCMPTKKKYFGGEAVSVPSGLRPIQSCL